MARTGILVWLYLYLLAAASAQSCPAGQAASGSAVLIGSACMPVAPIPLAGTGPPTASCSATTNTNSIYFQTDAKPGSRSWVCSYSASASAWAWTQQLGLTAVGVTSPSTAGLLVAGSCQTLTATVPGAAVGSFAIAAPIGLPTTLANIGAVTYPAIVTAANTVTVSFCASGLAITANAVTFGVLVY